MIDKPYNLVVSSDVGGVKVRKGPGVRYKQLDAIEPGHVVTVLDETDAWIKIEYDNPDVSEGWAIRSAFVKVLRDSPPCDVKPPVAPEVAPETDCWENEGGAVECHPPMPDASSAKPFEVPVVLGRIRLMDVVTAAIPFVILSIAAALIVAYLM